MALTKKYFAKIRLEDLMNRPGIAMDGYVGALVPFAADTATIPFKKGTVYTLLLKAQTVTTDNILPDQSAVAWENEAAGDIILVLGKETQEFV